MRFLPAALAITTLALPSAAQIEPGDPKRHADRTPTPKHPPRIAPNALVTTRPAPSDDAPWGVTHIGARRFVGRGEMLFELLPDSHVVMARHAVGVHQDLASDGEHLWLLPADWATGGAIQVRNADGEPVREVVTPPRATRTLPSEGAESPARRASSPGGIAFHDGRLFVLDTDGQLHELDPADGRLVATRSIGRDRVHGLTATGSELVTAARDALLWIDPRTAAVVREQPLAYPIRGLGWRDDVFLLQAPPEPGSDRRHPQRHVLQQLRWLPATPLAPGERIRVEVVRYAEPASDADRDLRRGLCWLVHGVRLETDAGLEALLHRLAPAAGSRVEIRPDAGTRYLDVRRTVDACAAARLDDVNFGGGLGPRKD